MSAAFLGSASESMVFLRGGGGHCLLPRLAVDNEGRPFTTPMSSPGLTGRSSIHGRCVLDRPVKPGDDSECQSDNRLGLDSRLCLPPVSVGHFFTRSPTSPRGKGNSYNICRVSQ